MLESMSTVVGTSTWPVCHRRRLERQCTAFRFHRNPHHHRRDGPSDGTLHVGFHILSGLELVRRIFIKEACLQFMLHERIGTEGKSLLVTALGIETGWGREQYPWCDSWCAPWVGPMHPCRACSGAVPRQCRHGGICLSCRVNEWKHPPCHCSDRWCVSSPDKSCQWARTSPPNFRCRNPHARYSRLAPSPAVPSWWAPSSGTCGVAAQTVFMEPVEYLMVGEETDLHIIIGKAPVNGFVYGVKMVFAGMRQTEPPEEDMTENCPAQRDLEISLPACLALSARI